MALSAEGLPDKSLLIVDDDAPFRQRLARAMEARGFLVTAAETAEEAVAFARKSPPAFAVVDLRIGQSGNGLDVVEVLHQARPDARVVMLTGYGNIATAVTAVKHGAIDYLSKPADADDVANAVVLLASRRTAFVTGQTWAVDGGISLA